LVLFDHLTAGKSWVTAERVFGKCDIGNIANTLILVQVVQQRTVTLYEKLSLFSCVKVTGLVISTKGICAEISSGGRQNIKFRQTS
jgi:hypothetical protein